MTKKPARFRFKDESIKTRVQFDMSSDEVNALNEFSKCRNSNRTNTIKDAIKLLIEVHRLEREFGGGRLVYRTEKGEDVILVIL